MRPLRIFYAVEKEPFKGSRPWYNNIVAALAELGHELIEFDFDIDPFYHHANDNLPENTVWIGEHRPRLEKALIEQINRHQQERPIDLLFTYFYNAHCTAQTIEEIKALGIQTYNWYCNASYQLNLVAQIAPAYDICLVPEHFRIKDYESLGATPVYCQEAANPSFYKDLHLNRDRGTVFIGQNYADRLDHCVALADAGVDVNVWGHHWNVKPDSFWRATAKKLLSRRVIRGLPQKAIHGPCTDQEMIAIYNQAKIVLGFSVVASDNFAQVPLFQIRLRDFEAPMCGAFYLTQHQDELDEFFEIGHEIETFKTTEELVDKVHFYLRHDQARERIASAGRRRAARDHSWQSRLEKIFSATLRPSS